MDEVRETLLGHAQERGEDGSASRVDEEELHERFKHIYWTRLMLIEDYQVDLHRKFELGPDVIEECQAIEEQEKVDPMEWEPVFEPT